MITKKQLFALIIGMLIAFVLLFISVHKEPAKNTSEMKEAIATSLDVMFGAIPVKVAKGEMEVRDRFGNTPLLIAINAANLERVNQFLAMGADPNVIAHNPDQDPALTVACVNSYLRATNDPKVKEDARDPIGVIKALLDAGANPNIENRRSLRPTHACIRIIQRERRMEALKLMTSPDILWPARLNAQTVDGSTVTHILVSMFDTIGVRQFLDEYSQVLNLNLKQTFNMDRIFTETNNAFIDRFTPLELVRRQGYVGDPVLGTESIELEFRKIRYIGGDTINKKKAISETDNYGRNGLMLAILRNDELFVINMIQSGTNLKATSKDGTTALMYAVISDDPVKYVKILLNEPATASTVNMQDSRGRTALTLVYRIEKPLDRFAVAQLLIGAGAKLNIKDKRGDTLISWAKKLADTTLSFYLTSIEQK